MIKNEQEILRAARKIHGAQVEWVALEELTMREQLQRVLGSKVVVGIHGAGLSHLIFAAAAAFSSDIDGKWHQPSPITLVELFPTSFQARRHFDYFSRWAGIRHLEVVFPEGGKKTDIVIPVNPVMEKVKAALELSNHHG